MNRFYSGPREAKSKAREEVKSLKRKYKILSQLDPKIMILLDSECDRVAEEIEPLVKEIEYREFNMPTSAEDGHKRTLRVGTYRGKEVLVFRGKIDYSEGYSALETSFPVYLGEQLGAKVVIMTNVAGIVPYSSVRNAYPAEVGDLLLVTSYYPFESSQRGPPLRETKRFHGTMNMPSKYLNQTARDIAKINGIELKDSIYVSQPGPFYETPVEIELLSELPGLVTTGRPTVFELEAAEILGIKSLVLTIVTHKCLNLQHEENIEQEVASTLGKTLDEKGKARHTLNEGEEITSKIINKHQPNPGPITEVTTKNLGTIIGGVVEALRF